MQHTIRSYANHTRLPLRDIFKKAWVHAFKIASSKDIDESVETYRKTGAMPLYLVRFLADQQYKPGYPNISAWWVRD